MPGKGDLSAKRRAGGLHLPPGLAACLRYEPFGTDEPPGSGMRREPVLDPSFPLAVKLLDFVGDVGVMPMIWHERLELFCPLAGVGAYRIGERLEPFERADILLIDSLLPHGVNAFEGPRRQALIVYFQPDLVAAPGALPCDLWLLRPFRHLCDGCLRLRARDAHAGKAWECLSRLVAAQLEGADEPVRHARQKLALSELLLALAEASMDRVSEHSEYELRRDRLRRLAPLLDLLVLRLDEALSVAQAAHILKMSPSYFMRFFRMATGLTFCAYVDQLRVSRAYQLLVESDRSLAEIAAETGFCDQCHLSRHIRRRFGESPGRIRSQQRGFDAARIHSGEGESLALDTEER